MEGALGRQSVHFVCGWKWTKQGETEKRGTKSQKKEEKRERESLGAAKQAQTPQRHDTGNPEFTLTPSNFYLNPDNPLLPPEPCIHPSPATQTTSQTPHFFP